ncbi:polyphosphate--glucose phosphotransferase [Corynebacterium confusum]|uniref:polyphosphate--glucose phosphotransferase n=1 Tax=Corynebacterium confusum TaxID=71254 RepID=UPI0025B318FF|nr:ROK family protein [Corynebacterium confusum]WJY89889.1 Polyphosphate glucokinase [Corynebacterium confusum]
MHTSEDSTAGNAPLAYGIDIGGSGIKGAIVDLESGQLHSARQKIATPQPSTPAAVAETVAEVVDHHGWEGPVGITVPAIVRDGIVQSAANIDPSWIGVDAQALFRDQLGGREVVVLNDADAAGLAEVAHGDPVARQGAAIFLTIGTGIGSAFLLDGRLFPNTELGHLEVKGKEAEHVASSAVKEREDLSFKKWAKRLNRVLYTYEKLFNPQVFIVGGGISRKFEKWGPHLSIDTQIVPAQLRNEAGIIGAAMAVNAHVQP